MIATEALTKRFGQVTAVSELSVDIGAGVVGLIGANGAGKSILVKILLGLLPATEGRAEVLDLDVATTGSGRSRWSTTRSWSCSTSHEPSASLPR